MEKDRLRLIWIVRQPNAIGSLKVSEGVESATMSDQGHNSQEPKVSGHHTGMPAYVLFTQENEHGGTN
jgi:hypothetical protein